MYNVIQQLWQARILPLFRSTVEEMTVHRVDPLRDPRWLEFLERHARASLFHTSSWLEALHRTYGYEPIAFTTSPPGAELTNSLVFCRVRSWLTGCRLVSLPFSDHCEPLVDSPEALEEILSFLCRQRAREGWDYIEMRSVSSLPDGLKNFQPSERFYLHRLDLHPSIEELLRSLDRGYQHKIRRAGRKGLTCEEGRTEPLLRKFYEMQLLTRKRHQLPPQPLSWFRNLMASMGERLNIRVASQNAQPAAANLTLRFRNSVVSKYGSSDERLNNLGGMVLVLWRSIEQAKQDGALEFDLGRSDWDNAGLVAFKSHLGASPSTLTYWRCPSAVGRPVGQGWKAQIAKQIFARTPAAVLTVAGKLLYRHIG